MTLQNRCAYIIPRKGRSCRMLVKAGQKYCGEHANQEEENERNNQSSTVSRIEFRARTIPSTRWIAKHLSNTC
ncbi:hypothetical protein Y032_0046g1342 [Ancylostoma ceylanicum]|uniref:Zinc finger CCCH-type TRM13 domain-containing protein n=1 Tax=Ancylostoma ceylanicum TaxID=53326 RepID=A0A016UCI6_9BILA|nr:hypothetical protein Y032_0046g1342 [Ancylostoma ceylanicum]